MKATTTGDESVDDDEVLLRRYAVRGRGHVEKVVDQATGRRYLTGKAFQFNPDCSVSRTRILDDHDIPYDEVRYPGYASLARLVAGEVHACTVIIGPGIEVQPFQVTSSPWPGGREDADRADVAHASIKWSVPLDREPERRAKTMLARIASLDPADTTVEG